MRVLMSCVMIVVAVGCGVSGSTSETKSWVNEIDSHPATKSDLDLLWREVEAKGTSCSGEGYGYFIAKLNGDLAYLKDQSNTLEHIDIPGACAFDAEKRSVDCKFKQGLFGRSATVSLAKAHVRRFQDDRETPPAIADVIEYKGEVKSLTKRVPLSCHVRVAVTK